MVSGGRGHRAHPDQDPTSADQGLYERLHTTMLNEFYRVAFRKKIYRTFEDIQVDLDARLDEYHQQRSQQWRSCYGTTLMQTFVDGMPLAKEKVPAASPGEGSLSIRWSLDLYAAEALHETTCVLPRQHAAGSELPTEDV